MFTDDDADHPGSGQTPGASRDKAYFDFVIAERPVYIPNSGPPLAPISVMPPHDKDGIIVEVLQLHGKPHYVVSYEGNPNLRIGVVPERVREWVSARTHEEWDLEQIRLRDEEERRIRDSYKKVKKGSRADGIKGKPGRKRKRPLPPVEAEGEDEELPARARKTSLLGTAILPPASGPGRKRKQVEEKVLFASPKASQKSQGPSLISPSRGLADVIDLDTDEEDDDNAALNAQLLSGLTASNMQHSASTTRNSSRGPSLFNDNGAVPTASSRAARRDFEDLESSNKVKRQTIAQKYTNFPRSNKSSSQFSSRPGMFSPPTKNDSPYEANPSQTYKSPYFQPPRSNRAGSSREYGIEVEEDNQIVGGEELSDEEQNSEGEYEVDEILKEEMRAGQDGKRRLYYLIKWVGQWDDTWEPAANVGDGAIKEYKEKKRAANKKSRPSGGTDPNPILPPGVQRARVAKEVGESEDELFVSDRKGKGKAVEYQQPAVIDDEGDDLSD